MAKVKYENMRSCWEFGEASECRRGLMCGMGYTEEEQKRPPHRCGEQLERI